MPNDFDIAAKNYDASFTFSSIGKAQRKRVYQFLSKKILTQPLSILELNCGTGQDAIFFSEKGHEVLATDISMEMIETAKGKDNLGTVKFIRQDINSINSETFRKKFDLIFSNFGGLNCLSPNQLDSFLKRSSSLLKPSGKMVLVLMPKHCLWERFYFSIKGEPNKATRRNTKDVVLANVDGIDVPTWYYNPKDIVTLAGQDFKPLAIKPIGMAIPPSYLEPYFSYKRTFLKLLIKIEGFFNARWWAKYADHYIIAFQKT